MVYPYNWILLGDKTEETGTYNTMYDSKNRRAEWNSLHKGMYFAWFHVNEIPEQEKLICGEKKLRTAVFGGGEPTGKGHEEAFWNYNTNVLYHDKGLGFTGVPI